MRQPKPTDDDLEALVADALRGERCYRVGGNEALGWWTGRLGDGTQLLAAPYGDELHVVRFDAGGDLRDVGSITYPEDDRPESEDGHPIVADHVEAALRLAYGEVVAGVIAVKPFWVEAIEFELHPLPDWARQPLEVVCKTAARRRELLEWLAEGWCQVEFAADGCWYDGEGAAHD